MQCTIGNETAPLVLGPLIAPLFVLARQGVLFEVMAFVFASATILLMLLEGAHPQVRLRRKTKLQPEIELKIGGPSS